MAELPSGLVAYNQPVRCVRWNNTETRENPVMVECDEESIAADHVIVTVPLGRIHAQVNCFPPEGMKCCNCAATALFPRTFLTTYVTSTSSGFTFVNKCSNTGTLAFLVLT